jgi:putative acetyltransferase
VIIREEHPEDREASIEVERAAFGRADEATIVELVRDLQGSVALVLEVDGEIGGHVQMSAAHVGETEVLALGPIGVVPARQRRGGGSALVAAALEHARTRAAPAVIVLGDPAYYGRRGFEPASRYGLRNPFAGIHGDGFEIDEADLQIAVLDRDLTSALRGDVRWAPAFY